MSDATPAIDTSAQMSADISAALTEVLGPEGAAPSEVPAETAPVADATATAPDAPATESAPATPPALADDTPIEIVVDGVPITITLKEARENGMRHAAFTKKTQALATERKAFETERAEAALWKERGQAAIADSERFKAEVRSWLTDPNKLGALYLAAQNGQIALPQGSPAPAPSAPAPINPQEMAAQIEQQVIARLQQEQSDLALVNDVESFTHALVKDDPTLSVLGQPFLDAVYQKVGTMGAKDVAEFKEFVRLEIQDYQARLGARSDAKAKEAAAAKAAAVSGIQRGGSPVAAPKKEYDSFEAMKPDIESLLNTLTAGA